MGALHSLRLGRVEHAFVAARPRRNATARYQLGRVSRSRGESIRRACAMARGALMHFLQGNTALVIGLVLLTLVALGRALAKEQQLKVDLRGGLLFLGGW